MIDEEKGTQNKSRSRRRFLILLGVLGGATLVGTSFVTGWKVGGRKAVSGLKIRARPLSDADFFAPNDLAG